MVADGFVVGWTIAPNTQSLMDLCLNEERYAVVFNIFINVLDLDEGIEGMFCKFAGNRRPGGGGVF